MLNRAKVVCTIAASGFAVFAAIPAQALTMQECSAKYKEAQTAGTLKGQKWNDFRKAECGSDAAATPAAAPAGDAKPALAPAAAACTPGRPAPRAPQRVARTPVAARAPAPAAPSNAVFPSAVSSKYSKET